MGFNTDGDDAPAPHIAMRAGIEDLGGSVRRIRITHDRTGDELTRDVDFMDEDEREVLAELLRDMMARHEPTVEG